MKCARRLLFPLPLPPRGSLPRRFAHVCAGPPLAPRANEHRRPFGGSAHRSRGGSSPKVAHKGGKQLRGAARTSIFNCSAGGSGDLSRRVVRLVKRGRLLRQPASVLSKREINFFLISRSLLFIVGPITAFGRGRFLGRTIVFVPNDLAALGLLTRGMQVN